MSPKRRSTISDARGALARAALTIGLAAILAAPGLAQRLELPLTSGSVRFAVVGDTGTGSRAQYEVAARLAQYRRAFPFTFAIMLGDNLYGGENPRDYATKFERPFKPLLDAGVKFYASLGNHDEREQKNYALFNMNGETYYTFKPPGGSVRFFALESDYMDARQLQWLEKELKASDSDWKIAFFHHPIYSSGRRHGSNLPLREALEPLFTAHGVNVVFAGHEHFYERLKPQKGVYYFTQGGGAKLREDNLDPRSTLTARGFDTDNCFTLVEIAGDELFFQTIARTGETVDAGVIRRTARPAGVRSAAPE
jgi:hypothetical protein